MAGDGRNDSPGHSAKYCVYTLMEQFLDIVVDLEVVDKRENWWLISHYGEVGAEATRRKSNERTKNCRLGDRCIEYDHCPSENSQR